MREEKQFYTCSYEYITSSIIFPFDSERVTMNCTLVLKLCVYSCNDLVPDTESVSDIFCKIDIMMVLSNSSLDSVIFL